MKKLSAALLLALATVSAADDPVPLANTWCDAYVTNFRHTPKEWLEVIRGTCWSAYVVGYRKAQGFEITPKGKLIK